jgi:hypothetical protein
LFRARYLIWLAGLVLIGAGILCLYLSSEVARPGSWWQGTLDAFGVGFVVGGIIDVLAITALNQRIAADDQARRKNNKLAEKILRTPLKSGEDNQEVLEQASNLLDTYLLDRQLRDRLWYLYSRLLPRHEWQPWITPEEQQRMIREQAWPEVSPEELERMIDEREVPRAELEDSPEEARPEVSPEELWAEISPEELLAALSEEPRAEVSPEEAWLEDWPEEPDQQ